MTRPAGFVVMPDHVLLELVEAWDYARRQHAEPPDTAHPTARQGSEIEERDRA